MKKEIERLINDLEYTYEGFNGKYHKFSKMYPGQKKKSHQEFEEIECLICKLPYFKRRYAKSYSHVACSCKLTIKTRKPRRKKNG